MRAEWNYPKMEKKELFQLHFQATSPLFLTRLLVTSGPFKADAHQPEKEAPPPPQPLGKQTHELYRIGGWLVESKQQPYGLEVLLRRTGEGPLEFTVQSGAILNVRLLRHPIEEKSVRNVARLCVEADKVRIWHNEPQSKKPADAADPKAELTADKPSEKDPHVSPNAAQESMTAMASELTEAKNQAQALEQTAAQLRDQLEAERKRNADLQTAASAHLTELLEALTPQREQLAETLREQLERAGEARSSMSALEEQVEAAKQALEEAERKQTETRAELERLRSLETLRTLDCGDLEKELSGLRARLEADGYSADLLKEEAFFNREKLQSRIEDARKLLEELEGQLAQAVRQREWIDRMVQNVALKENGVISLEKELGGGADGSGGAAEKNS